MLKWESGWTIAKPPDTDTKNRQANVSNVPRLFYLLQHNSAVDEWVVGTYRRIVWFRRSLRWSRQGLASIAQWRGRDWQGHPFLQIQQEYWPGHYCSLARKIVSASASYGPWGKRSDRGRNVHVCRFIYSLMKTPQYIPSNHFEGIQCHIIRCWHTWWGRTSESFSLSATASA